MCDSGSWANATAANSTSIDMGLPGVRDRGYDSSMPVELTEAAVERISWIKNKEQWQNRWLRLAVRGGGCSGFSYVVDFVEAPEDSDKRFTFGNDVQVCIDKKSYFFLNGITLDFESDLIHTGFKFVNPSAETTCSCGESFSI